jgi:hypothetical protein
MSLIIIKTPQNCQKKQLCVFTAKQDRNGSPDVFTGEIIWIN